MKMRLETFGCGTVFDKNKFKPIKNKWIKPGGGLWSSPVGSEHSWSNWCLREGYDLDRLLTGFQFDFTGSVFVVNCEKDLDGLVWDNGFAGYEYPDFEELARRYDAFWLTGAGEKLTRWIDRRSFYGWDCETVLVMNASCVSNVVPVVRELEESGILTGTLEFAS